MKKVLLLLITLILLGTEFKAQTWAQLTDFPATERDDGVAFVINNKAYCGTGLKVGWVLAGDFHCLDLGTETWSTVVSMPAGKERQYACGFTDGTNGFVFGGEAFGSDLNDLWMYSPTTNSWTAMASKPGNGVRGASCFVIGNIAYIIGGAFTTNDAINEVWAYDMIGNTWTQKNNLPITNWRGCASSANNMGYLLFGKNLTYQYNRYLYEYDPIADGWTFKSTFGGAGGQTYAKMETVNNQLVIFSGIDSLGSCSNDLWTYSLVGNSWLYVSSLMSSGRKGGMSFSNNGTFYYTCGITPSPTNTRLKETWKTSYAIGIKEFENKKSILIYPNPASDIITIQFSESDSKNSDYKIIGMKGEIVLEGILNDKNQIQVSTLPQGVYQIVIRNSSAKILIE